MKLFKLLTISLIFLFVGINLLAEDQNNPPECLVWGCEKEIELEAPSTTLSDVDACNGIPSDLQSQKEAEAESLINIIQGREYCISDPSCTRPTKVKKSDIVWSPLTAGQPNDKGETTYTLTGSATSEAGCEDDITFTFLVKQGVAIQGDTELLACEDKIVLTAVNGTAEYTWRIVSGDDHVSIESNGKTCTVTGTSLGNAVIGVTDGNKCYDEHSLEVKNCVVEEEPTIDEVSIELGRSECINGVMVYYYFVEIESTDGKYKFCDEKGKIQEEKISIGARHEHEYEWLGGGNVLVIPNGFRAEVYKTNTQPLSGSLTVTVKADWEACDGEESGEIEAVGDKTLSDPVITQPLTRRPEPTSFAPNNKYASLDIYGKPIPVNKPQQEQEKDRLPLDFSIDAYNLSASFATTDISIPLQGSDLKLELRRTNGIDSVNSEAENQGALLHKHILGKTWRSNLATYMYTYTNVISASQTGECDDPVSFNPSESYWVVVDDNGGEFKYDLGLNPFKKHFSDRSSGQHNLSYIEDQGYLFRKQNGTTYKYEPVPGFFVGDSNGLISATTLSNFHRVSEITDRNGNTIKYHYHEDSDIFPWRLQYEQNHNLYIDLYYEDDRLIRAVDPMGREINYNYDESGFLGTVQMPYVKVATENYPKVLEAEKIRPTYTYSYGELSFDKLSDPSKGASLTNPHITYTTTFLGGIVDAEENRTILNYSLYEPESQFSQPFVYLSTLNAIGQGANDSFSGFSAQVRHNFIEGSRGTLITDASGDIWSYSFTGTIRNMIPSNSLQISLPRYEIILEKFSRSLNSTRNYRMEAEFETSDDSVLNLTRVIDYNDIVTEYVYGLHGDYDHSKYNQPYQEIIDVGGLGLTKTFGYDPAFNQMTKIIDPKLNETIYQLDENGNRILEDAPEHKKTSFTYDFGYQTSSTDADGRRTVSKRIYNLSEDINDSLGWTDVHVQLLTYGDVRTYDDLNIDISTYTPSSDDDKIVTIKKFDKVGNLIEVIDANGHVTNHTYDDTNALEKTELPLVFDYDNQNYSRPTINYNRDKNRQILGKQDARGNWTLTKYDNFFRPVEVIVELPQENLVSHYSYTRAGNKEFYTDANETVFKYEYDAFNNLTKEIKDFEGLELTSIYEYGDNSGNDIFGDSGFVPTKKIDPKGIITILEYDTAYRLIKTYRGNQDSEELLSEIYYDRNGNVERTITYNNLLADLTGNYRNGIPDLLSGNQETYTEYDALNRPINTVVDLNGDGASIDDPEDKVTSTFYDIVGNVVAVVDPIGNTTQTEYDGAGRVVKQVVNVGEDDDADFDLDAPNKFTIIADQDDIVTTKSYDDNGNTLTQTLHNDTPGAIGDQTISKLYDELNRVTETIDPEGFKIITKYDLNNNIRTVENARNYTTETEYDAANRVIKQILPEVYDAESELNVRPEITTKYDGNNNIIETVDARGLKTLNRYDKLNRLRKTIQVLGATEEDPENIVSEFEYDANNNQIKSILFRDDETLITETVYDVLDRPLVTTDPEGFQSVVYHDLVGNKVRLFDKRSNAGEDGGVEDETLTRYSTDVKFDRANRVVKNILPEIPVAIRDNGFTVENMRPFSEIIYLKNNWIEETKDLNGNSTFTEYDAAGRKKKVTNAIDQEISYSYDKAGNILVQTVQNDNASGGDQVTHYTYDKRNLLLTETINPGNTNSRLYKYTYNANGNKKTRIFPNSKLTTYHYDALDRLEHEIYSEDPNQDRNYKYNKNGAVVIATDITGKVTYEYDLLGRQLIEEKFNTQDISVSKVESVYDKANNRVRCYLPDEKKTLVSSYDKRNLLTNLESYNGRVEPGNEPTILSTTTYTYDPNGLQKTCTLPNLQSTEKFYDKADRIESTTTSNGPVNSYEAIYHRDAVGNQLRTIETRSAINGSGDKSRTLDFEYDEIYRLTREIDDATGEVIENTYMYDFQGNRLSRVQKKQNEADQDTWIYTNDNLNRTLAVQIDLVGFGNQSSYSYQYDENGNRKLRTYINNEGVSSVHTYYYDLENRLISVVDSGGVIFEASYDYRTRRTSKTESTNGSVESITAYIYDGGVTCQEVKLTSGEEFDGTNAVLDKQYIRGNGMGGGIGSVLYMERPADFGSVTNDIQAYYESIGYGNQTSDSLVAEYYTYNAVGSVVANTDQDGYVIRENDFDAYGNIVREEDLTTNNFPIEFGGSQNDLLFSTKERDFSTGLDYFGFRYYDSLLGKFTSRDPSGYPDGPNNYLYVNNNPINSIDPLGLEEETIGEAQHWHHRAEQAIFDSNREGGAFIDDLDLKLEKGVDIHSREFGVMLPGSKHTGDLHTGKGVNITSNMKDLIRKKALSGDFENGVITGKQLWEMINEVEANTVTGKGSKAVDIIKGGGVPLDDNFQQYTERGSIKRQMNKILEETEGNIPSRESRMANLNNKVDRLLSEGKLHENSGLKKLRGTIRNKGGAALTKAIDNGSKAVKALAKIPGLKYILGTYVYATTKSELLAEGYTPVQAEVGAAETAINPFPVSITDLTRSDERADGTTTVVEGANGLFGNGEGGIIGP